MSPTVRTIIDTHGLDYVALRSGVQWLVDTAGDARGAIVFRQHAQANTLASVLPRPLVVDLYERGRTRLKGGPTLDLYDARTLPVTAYPYPILAVWADEPLLAAIDRIHPTAVCAIPWAESDLHGWRRGWGLDTADAVSSLPV